MIKKSKLLGSKTRVTFSLPKDAPTGAVSVVGCFNDWEPGRHEMVARKDGTRTVSVPLAPGEYTFRYLADGGVWLDDEHADHIDAQGGRLFV